ncbi:hypothetical protein [Actinokineospora sp. NPDC004072]
MFEPILANYTPDGDDWTVEVTAAGETRTATAPGLIAARDAADQLVDELLPHDDTRTVVHTLDGDAYRFTSAYLSARLGKPDETDQRTDELDIPTPPSAAPQAATPGHPTSTTHPNEASQQTDTTGSTGASQQTDATGSTGASQQTDATGATGTTRPSGAAPSTRPTEPDTPTRPHGASQPNPTIRQNGANHPTSTPQQDRADRTNGTQPNNPGHPTSTSQRNNSAQRNSADPDQLNGATQASGTAQPSAGHPLGTGRAAVTPAPEPHTVDFRTPPSASTAPAANA